MFMRLEAGDELLLFDGASGEWLARIAEAGKKRMTLAVERRTARAGGDARLLAGVRAGEAGADRLAGRESDRARRGAADPGDDRRTIAERVKLERLEAIAIEAAEQCGRTRLPEIAEPVALDALLDSRDAERTLYFADEAWRRSRRRKPSAPGPAVILIGPEGGFTDEERAAIRAAANSVADLARPADPARRDRRPRRARALYMAVAGDWR